MMMISYEVIERCVSVDMGTADTEGLTDIGGFVFDKSLPKERRLVYALEALTNPFCFRCGEMGVKLTFDDRAPPLQEVLTGFLVRKKGGL